MFQRYHNDKAKGIKHTPLHTLQECCEEAGIDHRLFGRYAAQFPNAPQPVLQHAKNVARSAVKYYRKNEFVQWVNQVRQQKEKAMPDIKTALQAALSKTANEWAADDEAHHKTEPKTEQAMPENAPPKAYFTTTNNVCRATFEYIRDNPGKTRKEVMTALSARGYKDASTTTLIGQMVKQYHVRETQGLLYATTDHYVPLKGSKAWAKLQASAQRKHVTLVSKSTGKVINPRPAPAPVVVPVEKEWTPDDVISKLNVHQALALFKALRNILVG
jgi:hypothetical protein